MLTEVDQQRVNRTIDVLKLNHMDVRQSRKEWLLRYALGKIPFDFLAEMQPFVTQELQRQDLIDIDKLRKMFE